MYDPDHMTSDLPGKSFCLACLAVLIVLGVLIVAGMFTLLEWIFG